MKRLSFMIQDLVSDIDAYAGKCNTISSESEEIEFGLDYLLLPHMLVDVALVSTSVVLDRSAAALELLVTKPLYSIENKILGKSEDKPGFIYNSFSDILEDDILQND